MTTPDVRYAGLVTRTVALVVDVLVLAATVSIIAAAVPAIWAAVLGSAPGWLRAGTKITAALLPLAYFTLCWWATGQTIGAAVFGVVVRRESGRKTGVVRSLLRALAGLLVPVIWLVGMVTVLSDRRRRALHDMVFGTVVLRKPPRVAPPPTPGRPPVCAAPARPANR